MAWIAGGYTATFNDDALGTIEDGFELELTPHGEEIVGDNLGPRTIQDMIYQGGVAYINFSLTEWSAAGVRKLMWPWTTESDNKLGLIHDNATQAEPVGRLVKDILDTLSSGKTDKGLKLTAIANTKADSTGEIKTLRAQYAFTDLNFPVRWVLSSRLRRVPIRCHCLPYLQSGTTIANGEYGPWIITSA